MTGEINGNVITASVLTELIKASFENTAKGLSNSLISTWRKVFEDFEPFMREAYQRSRYIRILCKKDQDVDLYDVYITSTFTCDGKTHTDDEVIHLVRERKKIVVVGNGGAGKTCFMRHLWLTIFQAPQSVTPLFLELRKMNELTSVNLRSFIRASISRAGLDENLFNYFCKNGRFTFILDGFDEISQARQEIIESQITDLASEFPDCAIVVSSRDDVRFAGWQNFAVFESNPLSLDQSRQLVSKIPFHEDTRRLFLKQLDKEFFDQNRAFLENPLLTVMMLMTFKDNMEMPNSLSIFYDQALSTLHQWHDSTKSYKREKTLDIEQFRRSFGMFCLISYYKQMFEFTVSDIKETIAASNRANSFNFPVDDVLWDYEKAINLIRQDGLSYVFIHRSFQEYFAALAMARFRAPDFPEFLPLVLQRTSDSVLQLCFELDRDLVVKHFVKNALAQLVELGFGKSDINSRFKALERSNASFVFIMRKDKGKYHPSSLGVPIRPELTNLYSNFARAMRGDGIVIDPLHETLLGTEIFNSFEGLASVAKHSMIMVTFKSGDLVVQVADEGSEWFPASAEVTERLIVRKDQFRQLNKMYAGKIKTIMTWATRQVESLADRGKSLNEILGI